MAEFVRDSTTPEEDIRFLRGEGPWEILVRWWDGIRRKGIRPEAKGAAGAADQAVATVYQIGSGGRSEKPKRDEIRPVEAKSGAGAGGGF